MTTRRDDRFSSPLLDPFPEPDALDPHSAVDAARWKRLTDQITASRLASARDPRARARLATLLHVAGVLGSNVSSYRHPVIGPGQSVRLLAEAVRIRRALAAADPTRLPRLAESLIALADLVGPRDENGQADGPVTGLTWAAEALAISRRLASTETAAAPARRSMARSLLIVGELLFRRAGRGSCKQREAYEHTLEAVEVWRTIADEEPRYLADLSDALGQKADQLDIMARWREALVAGAERARLLWQIAADSHRIADLLQLQRVVQRCLIGQLRAVAEAAPDVLLSGVDLLATAVDQAAGPGNPNLSLTLRRAADLVDVARDVRPRCGRCQRPLGRRPYEPPPHLAVELPVPSSAERPWPCVQAFCEVCAPEERARRERLGPGAAAAAATRPDEDFGAAAALSMGRPS